ncbi:MAG: cation diffusion facilitator family transporter [Nocardioidaceae bacterium]
MSVGASHGPSYPAGSAGARHRWRLAVTFALVAGFLIVELVTALAAGSLALLSDAGHMAADVVTLGAALVATRIAARPDTTGRRTYGSYRAEVFASGVAVLSMLAVAAYVAVEAVRRIDETAHVAGTAMIAVGVLGLAVNLVSMLLLRPGAGESLNVKGAYLEVVADAAGSAGVVAAGVLVNLTGEAWWDTVVALLIGVFIAVRAILLGREVVAVLAQHVPPGMTADEIERDLRDVPGVTDVHDLHLWSLTSGMHVATAHLVRADDADSHAVLDRAREVLRARHGVEHATLQVEPRTHTGCSEMDW